jgi:hypothetical protein
MGIYALKESMTAGLSRLQRRFGSVMNTPGAMALTVTR